MPHWLVVKSQPVSVAERQLSEIQPEGPEQTEQLEVKAFHELGRSELTHDPW